MFKELINSQLIQVWFIVNQNKNQKQIKIWKLGKYDLLQTSNQVKL